MKAKPLVPKVAEFQVHKAWINELYEYSGDAIRAKKTVTAHTSVLTRTQWLLTESRRLTAPMGGIDTDMAKIAKFFDNAVIDHEKAIKGGQFLRVNAAIFSKIRWVVRELEKIILTSLDEDEAMLLRAERVGDRGASSTLDVSEILDEEESPKPRLVAAGMDDEAGE